MLNCWCITYPVGFKRLSELYMKNKVSCMMYLSFHSRDFSETPFPGLRPHDLHTWEFSCDVSIVMGGLLEEKESGRP
jgi:hypothetical protein